MDRTGVTPVEIYGERLISNFMLITFIKYINVIKYTGQAGGVMKLTNKFSWKWEFFSNYIIESWQSQANIAFHVIVNNSVWQDLEENVNNLKINFDYYIQTILKTYWEECECYIDCTCKDCKNVSVWLD